MKHVKSPTRADVPKNTAIHDKSKPLAEVNCLKPLKSMIKDTTPKHRDGIYLIIFFLFRKCIRIVIIIFITTIIGKIFSFDEC